MLHEKILKGLYIVAIIIVLFIIVYIAYDKIQIKYISTYKPDVKTEFCKVKNTGYYKYYDEVDYCESYVVINSPDNTEDLKREILNYEKENPLKEDELEKCDVFIREYFKEDKKMYTYEKEWDCECTFEERFAEHLIARSLYSNNNNEIEYMISPLDSKYKEVDRVWFTISN